MALEGHRKKGVQFTQVNGMMGCPHMEAAYGLQAVHEEVMLHSRRHFCDWVLRSFLRNASGAVGIPHKKLHFTLSVIFGYAYLPV
jgi:hypothetical protein